MFKNTVKFCGLMILTLFSFFYTEKTVSTIKNQDPLMMELNMIKDEYKVDAHDVIKEENNIIPGMIGCEVDVDKSYTNLKRLGTFNSNLLVYKDIFPDQMLDNHYDKYIIKGNKEKNMVTLIFKVKYDTKIDNIVKILKNKKVKATFFIDGKYIENNIEKVKYLIKNNHEVLNYGYDNKYDKDLIAWNNNLIDRINYNNPKFCYTEEENYDILTLCGVNKMHTIIPSLIVKNNPLTEVKSGIEKGSLISFNINLQTEKELNLVINYINQKGYTIDVLSKHLKEEKLNNCKK
ncbi:MAG: polysaccharide deacetylase family protein [Bacilli bacterium]|nr:polysaccharide deacetylase family protein [Bacilli bacterium]